MQTFGSTAAPVVCVCVTGPADTSRCTVGYVLTPAVTSLHANHPHWLRKTMAKSERIGKWFEGTGALTLGAELKETSSLGRVKVFTAM